MLLEVGFESRFWFACYCLCVLVVVWDGFGFVGGLLLFFLSEKWSIVSPIILLFLYLMIMSFSVSSESSAFSGLKVM